MKKKLVLFLALSGLFVANTKAQYKDYYSEGTQFLNEKKYALAEETFADGIKEDSSIHILYASLANAMMMQGRFNDADSVLDVVLKKSPQFLGALWFKGLNYFNWDRDSLSVVYMKKYLALANMDNNQVVKGYYYAGRAYEKLLATKGLTQAELGEMIAFYQKYANFAEGHPVANRVLGFVEEVKKYRPAVYEGRWAFTLQKK